MSSMAASATLHCLTGCAIGEIVGLIAATALGWGNGLSTAVAIALAFVFGYTLSATPLLRAGIPAKQALLLVLAADTVSIATMELVDNLVMWLVPGAMDARLMDLLFWVSMAVALVAAYVAAYPVNKHLLRQGRGTRSLTTPAVQRWTTSPWRTPSPRSSSAAPWHRSAHCCEPTPL